MFFFIRASSLAFLIALSLGSSLHADSASDPNNLLPKKLGWVDQPNTEPCSSCGGYYDETSLPTPSALNFKKSTTTIKADPPVDYKINGNVEFQNGVTINQPGRSLYAKHATITPNLKTGKLDAINAEGNIRLAQPGQLLLAKSIQANLVDHKASAVDVDYLIRVSAASPSFLNTTSTDPNFTGYAHGSADKIEQENQTQFSLSNATYSTCPPTTRTWELDAHSIKIDQATGRGEAYNTLLKVHGVPILYLPYFNFPTNNARKSGFLYGSIMSSSQSGLIFGIPYYFNLAPNYDDTFTPTVYSKRGVLLSNNFRYLTQHNSGSINLDVIPYDQLDNDAWRYGYTFKDNSNYNNWNTDLNYNGVSDDSFLEDFSVFNANQILLNRSFTANYQNVHWNFSGLLQSYQIVNTELTTVNRPYSQLPSLTLNGQYPGFLGPLSFSINTNVTRFTKSPATTFETPPVEGDRLNVNPTLSLPFTQSYGYFTPIVSLDSTSYSLNNAAENGFPRSSPSTNLPIINVDSSLYFDRDFSWDHKTYSQSLAPRLYYLYVPYRNQNDIPVFDTTIVPFSFSQLFTTNSFSGYDRTQNANQISYALTSSVHNPSGAEVLSGGIGQIWYFANRNVSLCETTPGSPPCIQTENPEYNQRFSDVAAYFNYNFNSAWTFSANITYDPNVSLLDLQEYALAYTPNNMDVLNLSYQNNHKNYSLLSNQQVIAGTPPPRSSIFNGSFVLGMTPTWATFGDLSYSLENNGPIAEFAGIQYSSCCWAIRLGDYRYVVNNNPNTPNILTGSMSNTVLLQFLLKGLGGMSSGPVNNLLASIPSYHGQLGF